MSGDVDNSSDQRDEDGRFLTGVGGSKRTQFQPGVSGNPKGKPRGYNFRTIIRRKAAEAGIDVEDAIWEIFKSLMKQVGSGDVPAAKEILNRLCDPDPTGTEKVALADIANAIRAAVDATGSGGPMPGEEDGEPASEVAP